MASREREDEVARCARAFLSSDRVGDELARSKGKVQRPLPVQNPKGGTHSWVVPVVVKGRPVGYVRIRDEGLSFLGFASLRRQAQGAEPHPSSETWLSPAWALERAKTLAKAGERLSPPVLTFDRVPDRLAWKVEAVSRSGEVRSILVAGDTAYLQQASEDTIGGAGRPSAFEGATGSAAGTDLLRFPA